MLTIKSILLIIIFSFVFAGCDKDMTNTSGDTSGGTSDGTVSCSGGGINIANYEAFNKIREKLGGKYCLTADIAFAGKTDFEPIGTKGNPFTGTLDGGGHTIKNVKINKPGVDNVGVIGYAKGATIKKFVVENANVKGKSSVGAVVGEVHDSKIMELSVIGGSVEGQYQVGGLVGLSVNSAIENSYSTASATSTAIATSTAMVDIDIGGLVGYNSSDSSIKNSYATGRVTSAKILYNGGLVGKNYSMGVSNSYYDKESTKQTDTTKGTGVSKGVNIVKRGEQYYDSLGTSDNADDVEIFKDWQFGTVWSFKEGQWPKFKWQISP